MSRLPTWGVASLVVVVGVLLLSVVLVIVEVLRSKNLSAGVKAGWVAALVLTNFFAVVIYFAQGHTGRLARIASYLLMLGLFGSMVLVAAALVR